MSLRDRRADVLELGNLRELLPLSPFQRPSEAEGDGAASFALPTVIGAEVARALSQEIITLRFEPGFRLTEEEICSRYGVSRSPVREAFKALEADGLIIRSARRGVRVTPISRQDLDEVYSCRAALEGLAAAGAALNPDRAIETELAEFIDALEPAITARNIPEFFKNSVAFTSAIHRHCANKTLTRILEGIDKQARRYRYLAHTWTHEMLEVSLQNYREVREAIVLQNAPMAQRRATRMIRRAHRIIARALTEAYPALDGGDAPPRGAP
ncbi:GntR family transcriptional regulator [Enterovirga sp. CN4-39]|uniref:GntR family transcriptional regulator n=1 Tax=Enterovirga sp. CN4-39 TaxID=3400910 RepID=UPI003BFFF5B3